MTPFYERTIVGTWLIGFMAIMAIIMYTLIAFSSDADEAWWPPLLLIIVPLFLGVMRIAVTPKELRLRFWLGLPRRTVPIEDVEAYRVTRSLKETGFGIQLKPERGSYCMSGPSAVSILLKNGRTLTIGTPEPERLVKALDKARKRAGIEE